MFNITKRGSKRQLFDNFVFYLHYRWTVLLLVCLCFIITCKLFLGDSFSCKSSSSSSSPDFLETLCYADNVYILPDQLKNRIHTNVLNTRTPDVENRRRYQSYYSWVNLLFLVHAFNFYLPHLFWKSYDSGYMSRLTAGLEALATNDDHRGLELCYLAKYILVTQGKHKLYTAMYILCELCNYVISLSHTLWLVYFFDVTGVPDHLSFHIESWWDFQQFYFPPLGICADQNWNKHKESVNEAVCMLPLNRLYMFMFLFVHAWYILLTILSGAVLIYRIALLVPSLRVNVIRFHAPLSERPTLKSLCCRLSYSDWFFLCRFRRVMTDIDFAQMLEKIAIVAQCKTVENQVDEENRFSLYKEIDKTLDSATVTSPV